MTETQQKSLVLILARELAANVATPILVTDAVGTMVFYNEAADRVLGQSFQRTGELKADEWRPRIHPKDADGSDLAYGDLPLVVALTDRAPSHHDLQFTAFDGVQRHVSVTAIPLLGPEGRLAGGLVIFWERTT